MRGRLVGAAALAALAASCATAPDTGSASSGAFAFAVIGDIPYSEEDKAFLDGKIVPAIQAADFPFVIHVGDTKSGGAPCSDALDDAHEALIASLKPKPVFYTPGDNEWTDCDRFPDPATGKLASELKRLEALRARFFAGAVVAPAEMSASRQAELPENETWRYDGVRFATLHITGTNNGRAAVMGDDAAEAGRAVASRDAADIAWIKEAVCLARGEKAKALVFAMQSDMTDIGPSFLGKACAPEEVNSQPPCDGFVHLREAVHDAAVDFGGPVLLIHGDTEPFTFGREFAGGEAPNLWVLNAAGDVHQASDGSWGGFRDATLVMITPGGASPFSARGLVTSEIPESN